MNGKAGLTASGLTGLLVLVALFRVTVHFGGAGYASLLLELRPAERYNVLLLRWPDPSQVPCRTTLVVNSGRSWRCDW